MRLDEVYLYRMIHVDNIPHILSYGITKKGSPNANPNFRSIGDLSLIDTRSTKMVYVDNGDLTMDNPEKICLGDFIPFYFGIRMPMLYVMQMGGNFVEKATPPENIVYLACSLAKIIETGMDYYFSDGHGTDNLSSFYGRETTASLTKIVDWQSVKAMSWGGHENLNIKRKKQAEFLASSDIPPQCLSGFVCYNESTKSRLSRMGIMDEKIKTSQRAYY